MRYFNFLLFLIFFSETAYSQKNIDKNVKNKFHTECRLLEAEISLLLFYADDKFTNKPVLISKYLKEVNFHEIVDSWAKLCK